MLITFDHSAETQSVYKDRLGDVIAAKSGAMIIVNADDWGRDAVTTDRSLECARRGAVSSVSAMMFMEDSERAAALAREHGVDAGLHLNLTTLFTAPQCPSRLADQQARLARFLTANRFTRVLYHPGLSAAFEYVVRAQLEEYERCYGVPPERVDGHHHMHLCANVFFQQLLPAGAIVRRNFSFAAGEKSRVNRWYRRWQDRGLARRHRVTDFFFSLPPLEPRSRLEKFLDLADRFDVELETHPAIPEEYAFLVRGELFSSTRKVGVAPGYLLRFQARTSVEGSIQ
jgi:chitin disaccharide deacetylase